MGKKDFDDFRSESEFQLEEAIRNRLRLIAGLPPIGFIFIPSTLSCTFHIVRNERVTHCGKTMYKHRCKPKRKDQLLRVRNLSEVKKISMTYRRIHMKRLCIICENNFLGLLKKERYTLHDGHRPLYSLYNDEMIITKDLLYKLQNPGSKKLPVLKNLKSLKNFVLV